MNLLFGKRSLAQTFTLIAKLFKSRSQDAAPILTAPDTNKPESEQRRGIYIPDAAVQDPTEDRFDRKAFADRIAETLGAKIDPSSIVIGVYGAWGDGKTTVLNFVEKALARFESVICVKFNPWRFEDESVLLRTFFESLARALNRRLFKNREEVGKVLDKYGAVVSSTVKAIRSTAESSGVAMPGGAVPDVTDAVGNLGAVLSATSLDELRTRIDSLLSQEKKRVVVLMDDIDRLDKSEIQTILRLVKLTADFRYTAYILAFDHNMVAAAVGERYSGDPQGSASAGASFLEKIVQVPLNLPPIPQSALLSFCNECVDEAITESGVHVTLEEAQVFASHFQVAVAGRLTTPRMAKRYANGLAFSLAILKGEVHMGDLMLLEAMRVFYPELYLQVRKNKDLMLGIGFYSGTRTGTGVQEAITQLVSDGTKTEKEQAKDLLLALFPRTSAAIYGSEWEQKWAEEKRIAARDYFDRYFTYAIAATDISDIRVQNFVNSTAELTIPDGAQQFATLINAKNAGMVVAKLRLSEDKLNSKSASAVAMAVALNSEALPNFERLGPFSTPLAQAAILVSQLLRRIPDESERVRVCSAVFSDSPSLVFACEVLRWCASDPNEKEKGTVFSRSNEDVLKAELVSRIIAHLQKSPHPIYLAEPHNALTYLLFGQAYGATEEIRKYLKETLMARPDSVLEFLRTMSGRGWDMGTGLQIDSPFMFQHYDLVSKFVDTDAVIQAIRQKYGRELDSPDFAEGQTRDRDKALAISFLGFHKKTLAKQSAGKELQSVDPPTTIADVRPSDTVGEGIV
jgi:hypothetical protein